MIGRDEARAAARRELSRQLYRRERPGLVGRVLHDLGSWLGHAWDDLTRSPLGGAGVGLAALVVVVVAGLVVLRVRLGPVRTGSAGDLDAAPGRDAGSLRTEADRLAAAGAWPDAVRIRLRAVVRALEERDLLSPRPGRTATEVAAEAAGALPAAAGALRDAADAFEEIWYGGLPATAAAYARVVAADDLAGRTRPAATAPAAATSYVVPS